MYKINFNIRNITMKCLLLFVEYYNSTEKFLCTITKSYVKELIMYEILQVLF